METGSETGSETYEVSADAAFQAASSCLSIVLVIGYNSIYLFRQFISLGALGY